MKSNQVQRQIKERLKSSKAAGLFGGKSLKSFDLTMTQETDVWAISALCEDFSTNYEEMDSHENILHWCLCTLLESPTARLMVKEAMSEGWNIGIADRGGYDFHIDVSEKQIILDDNGLSASGLGRSDYFRNVLLVSMIRALRDVWQEKRHGGFDTKYGPENILMLERVRAADCDVMAILVAWEMRSEGFAELWRHMIGSDEGDMAMAFSGHLERDPSSLFNGRALVSAFNQWYRSEERVNTCDHETLEYMDDVIFEHMNMGASGSPFGGEKLTSIGIEVLSCLPDRTAYLQGFGREILSDPFYVGLDDDINQSHLAQIVHDMKVTYVQGIPFRDAGLAEKIFPGGMFTDDFTDDLTNPEKIS